MKINSNNYIYLSGDRSEKKLDKKNKENSNSVDKSYSSSANCLANYNISSVNFSSKKLSDSDRLDKYVIKDYKPQRMDSLDVYLNELKGLHCPGSSPWTQYVPKASGRIPWKIHLYADNQQDWVKLCKTVAPYLKDSDVCFKTVSCFMPIEELNGTIQQGKSFTVYPSSVEQFAQTAHDLNYIIKNSGLAQSGNKIDGDRELGDSGRIFYRYEYKKKLPPTMTLYMDNMAHIKKMNSLYDSNRGGTAYLAKDMTPADDVWLNFNPDVDGTCDNPLGFFDGDMYEVGYDDE